LTRTVVALGGTLLAGSALFAFPGLVRKATPVDLTGYVTVEGAVTAPVAKANGSTGPGYLGVAVVADAKGRPVADDVAPSSPAAKAGIRKGDVITQVGNQPVHSPVAFREWVQAHSPGEPVKLRLERDGKPAEVTVTLDAVSRPKKLGGAFLGVVPGERRDDDGVPVDRVLPRSPAASAGLQSGDRILKVNGADLPGPGRLTDLLTEKRPGDKLTLTVKRAGKEQEITATLDVERTGMGFGAGGGGGRMAAPEPWKKDVIRLAVVPIEFSDARHNSKLTPSELAKALFTDGKYGGQGPTGQPVSGSLNDYFHEVSAGKFHIEGRVLDWVDIGKKRGDYIQGSGTSNKTAVLVDTLDKLTARDGANALDRIQVGHWLSAPKPADAILFVYAGDQYRTNRGAVYYPHAGVVTYKGKRIPYFIVPEGGSRLSPVGVFVKPMGQLLGLPDLAARTENAGSEGLGSWCSMSDPFTTSRPQHFSAWCKERLGWLKPIAIDPTRPQKMILAPIESSPKECFKVLVRPDGSEYFLLEVRSRKGFDADLPGEGLLVWRVVNDRPILEESHGVEGPTGPTVHLGAVPFPSSANNSFTPDTIPSSRSPKGGGLPVYITDIRRLPDGRVCFRVGYEYE
jgi:M6 family metalloprotease-like protein